MQDSPGGTDPPSFGPPAIVEGGEYATLKSLVAPDPYRCWTRILEVTARTDDAGLFWVADVLEDLVIHHPTPFAARIEAELGVNSLLRQAFIDFIPTASDAALADHLLEIRERIEEEFGTP